VQGKGHGQGPGLLHKTALKEKTHEGNAIGRFKRGPTKRLSQKTINTSATKSTKESKISSAGDCFEKGSGRKGNLKRTPVLL